jgi:transposase
MEFKPVLERCCGIDVHKKLIVACRIEGTKTEVRKFGTTTDDIKEMTAWLYENDCLKCVMESTGVYWKPVYNIMEALDIDIIIANAQHIRNLPGRKTDVNDAEWLASCLQHGLINPSFIMNRDQREMRDITRYRKSLVEERAREINRLEKVLEGANIKLSSVVSNLNGTTSTNILKALINDSLNESTIGSMLCGSLTHKKDELLKACNGILSDTQKMLITAIMDHIQDMSRRIGDLDNYIQEKLKEHGDELDRIQEIPGIGPRSAQTIISELGVNMSMFSNHKKLSKWVGLCPGNNESAGKQKSGKTGKGNMALKTTLIQCAQVASRKEGSYFKAQYQRLTVRRGANRAKVAVAHSMLIAIYHMLKNKTHFKDLGEDYYNQFNAEKKINHHLKTIFKLGATPEMLQQMIPMMS